MFAALQVFKQACVPASGSFPGKSDGCLVGLGDYPYIALYYVSVCRVMCVLE